jgi:hypothetical protein
VYGYNAIGIFNNEDEFNNYPKFGNSTVGNVKLEDVNKDNKIDNNDIIRLANVLPRFTYGFVNTISYKNFDLNCIIEGVEGAKLVNVSFRQIYLGRALENAYGPLRDRWRSPSDVGAGEFGVAKQNLTGAVNQTTSQFIFNASYTRIKNITAGYTLPASLAAKMKIQNLRFYLSAQNWFTITKYPGYNPESNNYNGAAGGAQVGVDNGAYPLAKTFTFGLNLGF